MQNENAIAFFDAGAFYSTNNSRKEEKQTSKS